MRVYILGIHVISQEQRDLIHHCRVEFKMGSGRNNTWCGTHSHQDEPPTLLMMAVSSQLLYILEDGAVYAMFGTELFTGRNIRQVKSFTTDAYLDMGQNIIYGWFTV